MRLVPVLLAAALAAGCLGSNRDEGRFALYVTDAPDAIGDFLHLNVTVQKVTLFAKEGGKVDYRPIGERFDLTRLLDGNASEIIDVTIAVGNYTKVEIEIANATGALATGGDVPVKSPGNKVFVTSPFEVKAGEATHFVFDVQVVETGNGSYQFQPNANGSGPRSKAPEQIVES